MRIPLTNLIAVTFLPVVAIAVTDNFEDGTINTSLWSPWDASASSKGQITEVNGKLNYVFSGLSDSELGFIGLQSVTEVNAQISFSVSVDVSHSIVGSEIFWLGIAIETVNESGFMFFDLSSTADYRMYIDDRSGPGTFIQDSPQTSGSLNSSLTLNFDSNFGLFEYIAEHDDVELYRSSVGIASTLGEQGAMNWAMDSDDSFLVSIYGSITGADSITGDMTMDNFSLVFIPEERAITWSMPVFVIFLALIKRKHRTTRNS